MSVAGPLESSCCERSLPVDRAARPKPRPISWPLGLRLACVGPLPALGSFVLVLVLVLVQGQPAIQPASSMLHASCWLEPRESELIRMIAAKQSATRSDKHLNHRPCRFACRRRRRRHNRSSLAGDSRLVSAGRDRQKARRTQTRIRSPAILGHSDTRILLASELQCASWESRYFVADSIKQEREDNKTATTLQICRSRRDAHANRHRNRQRIAKLGLGPRKLARFVLSGPHNKARCVQLANTFGHLNFTTTLPDRIGFGLDIGHFEAVSLAPDDC